MSVISIVGKSGSGKTTSLRNLDPKSTFIINADKKSLSFKGWKSMYSRENKNYLPSSNINDIFAVLTKINAEQLHIKTVVVDTVNSIMVDDEVKRMKEKAFDKWVDLAQCIWELLSVTQTYRDDLNVVLIFHEETFLDEDGVRTRRILTNGKKLNKLVIETKLPIVLYSTCEGTDGNNKYFFETQANNSSGKTPMGMFDDFKIPNDLPYVLQKVNEYEA